MKIAIIGYGRMGREIEALAGSMGHEVVCIIDNEEDWKAQSSKLREADVAIEFSMPETAAENILRCFDAGLPVISGTTAWGDKLQEVEKHCVENGNAFLYASNFSIGMNITFEMNKKLAAFMKKYKEYKPVISETHHKGKKDAPSGTAITLANEIIEQEPELEKWINAPEGKTNELPIISFREDEVPGTHIISYDSEIDSIELKHTAHSRKGFAFGAVMAAEWVIGRQGCFSMKDIIYDEDFDN